jgi:hypothetical protein
MAICRKDHNKDEGTYFHILNSKAKWSPTGKPVTPNSIPV